MKYMRYGFLLGFQFTSFSNFKLVQPFNTLTEIFAVQCVIDFEPPTAANLSVITTESTNATEDATRNVSAAGRPYELVINNF